MYNIDNQNKTICCNYINKISSKLNYFEKEEWPQDLNPTIDKVGVFRIEAVKFNRFCNLLRYEFNKAGLKSIEMLLLKVEKYKKITESIESIINENYKRETRLDLDKIKKFLLKMLL